MPYQNRGLGIYSDENISRLPYKGFWNFVNFLKSEGIEPGKMAKRLRKGHGYLVIGGFMALLGFLDFIGNTLSSINFLVIAQLTVLAMVVISGPVIVFLLVARGGDL
ncbi:photosystem II reaction center protein Ycf12/Psb30 [Leptolyngbya ectocarpi]